MDSSIEECNGVYTVTINFQETETMSYMHSVKQSEEMSMEASNAVDIIIISDDEEDCQMQQDPKDDEIISHIEDVMATPAEEWLDQSMTMDAETAALLDYCDQKVDDIEDLVRLRN